MRTAVIIGGVIGMAIPIYYGFATEVNSQTSGRIQLPGADALPSWGIWAGVAGLVLLLLGLFVL